MATFKHKPDKVKYLNIVQTLDEIHQNYATNFQENRKNLPEKIKKLEELKKELDFLSSNKVEISDDIIRKKSSLKELIKNTEKEISDIKKGSDEIDYYTKTGDILMDYYSLLDDDEELNSDSKCINLKTFDNDNNQNTSDKNEKLQMINKLSQSKRKEKKPTKKRIKNLEEVNNNNNSKNILEFFSKLKKNNESATETNNSTIKEEDEDNDDDATNTETQRNTQINSQVNTSNVEKVVSNRATLFDLYLSMTDKKYASEKIKRNYIKLCSTCNIEKTFIQSEGFYVCTQCGEVEHVITEVPNHKDAENEKPRTPYKKQTHLAETLNQFQAKETTEIPDKVYNGIVNELKKMKLSPEELAGYKYSKAKIIIKQILKKLRFTTFYEHIPFILSKITNKPAPTISRETEELIKKMFKQTEEPFNKHCPKDRKNYLNYAFFFHKIFEILEMPEYADCFPLFKSRTNLKKADDVWEKICEELNWPYYPSL